MEPNLENFKKELLSYDGKELQDSISLVSDELFLTLETIYNMPNAPDTLAEDVKVLYPFFINIGPFASDTLIKLLAVMLAKNVNGCAESFGKVCKFYEMVNCNLEAMKAKGQTSKELGKLVDDILKGNKPDESPREES